MPPIGFEVLCTTSPIVASWTAEWYFVRRRMSGSAVICRWVVASAVAKVVATYASCETRHSAGGTRSKGMAESNQIIRVALTPIPKTAMAARYGSAATAHRPMCQSR